MAGDLFIENLTYNQRTTLLEAGATDALSIYHADKPWSDGALDGRIANATPGRVGLPAHGYLTFKGGSTLLGEYRTNGIMRLRLNDILSKCTRPAFLSTKASLNGWPGNGTLSAVVMLEAALTGGSVIIEYYKYDGQPLMTVFGGSWAKSNEV